MSHHDFPAVRDSIALESMRARLADLEPLCADLEREYRGLRRRLLQATKHNLIDGLTYELYNQPSGEYGDQGGIAWQWAQVDSQIGDIERDNRYIEYLEKQRKAS